MLIEVCDRCNRPSRTERVLDVDLCEECCKAARAWLKTQVSVPRRGGVTSTIDRRAQAAKLLEHQHSFHARQAAAMSGEPERRAYHGFMCLAKRGELEHMGRGEFRWPIRRAAE